MPNFAVKSLTWLVRHHSRPVGARLHVKVIIEWAKLGVAPVETNRFNWGMMSYCRVLRRGQRGSFLLIVDEGTLHFTYELRNGQPYFTNVKIKPPGELTSWPTVPGL